MGPIVIAVCNRKGGVGKTTTAVNVADELARRGKRVCLIDGDTQRNASLHCRVRLDAREHSPLYHVLVDAMPLASAARATRWGFDLVPGHGDLDKAGDEMRRAIGGMGMLVLREAVEEIPADRWDHIIIDCPPSIGDITNASLIAAHWALIPLPMQPFPFEGLTEVLDLMTAVQRRGNPALRLAGIFGTLVDENSTLAITQRAEAVERWGEENVLSLRIRRSIPLVEAQKVECPVWHHKPDSNGARDYAALVDELIARGVA